MNAWKLSRHGVVAGLCALLWATMPNLAWANKPALPPAVQTLVTAAEKEYKAGEYGRASELYEQAWKSVPADTQLLFNAARSAHLGKQFERADKLYTQLLTLPDVDPKYIEKAKGYLPDVQQGLKAARAADAKNKARDAEQLQRDKRYREAAAAYRDAYRLDVDKVDYLLRAGLAAAFGCDVAVAKLYLTEYLQKAPADAPDRGEAQVRMASVERDCAPAAQDAGGQVAATTAASPAESESAAVQPPPPDPASTPALSTLAAAGPPVWPKLLAAFAGPGVMSYNHGVATLVGVRLYLNAPSNSATRWRSAVEVAGSVLQSGTPNSAQINFELSHQGEDWTFGLGLGLGWYDLPLESYCITGDSGVSCTKQPIALPLHVSATRKLVGKLALFIRAEVAPTLEFRPVSTGAFVGAQFHL